MASGPNMVRNVLLTFAIGFFAAISPFLFMQLLPALLNPSLHLNPVNYLAIILTGVLIGVITSILFANQFEKKGPQDIFFYALGIPAILIATVCFCSANVSKMRLKLAKLMAKGENSSDIRIRGLRANSV